MVVEDDNICFEKMTKAFVCMNLEILITIFLKCIDTYVIKASSIKFPEQTIVEPTPFNGITTDHKK